MPHSFGKHYAVEDEDEGLIRPKIGTRVVWGGENFVATFGGGRELLLLP